MNLPMRQWSKTLHWPSFRPRLGAASLKLEGLGNLQQIPTPFRPVWGRPH